jgi:hypothetical protein
MLGHGLRSEGEENDMPVIEPFATHACEDRNSRASKQGADDIFYECADGTADTRSPDKRSSADNQQKSSTKRASGLSLMRTRPPSTGGASQDSPSASGHPRAYVPRGAPGARDAPSDAPQRMRSQPNYRLSMPPSIRLLPPDDASRPLPRLPHKSNSQSSIAYRPHPAYPVEEWRTRTPSPVRSVREGLSTPPLEKRKESRTASLMSAISSTWKRRGTPSSERQRNAEGGSERSASR